MYFDRKVTAFGLAALAALTSFTLVVLFVAGTLTPSCERLWLRDVPGENAVASIWRSNCGATTSLVTNVMVTSASTRRFDIDKVVYGAKERELKIEWENDTLLVGGPRDGLRTDHIKTGGRNIRIDVRR